MEPPVEPRSFMERRAVGELTPIDLEGKTMKEALRVLHQGIQQTHGCLEDHIRKQDVHNSSVGSRLDLMMLGLNLRQPEPGEAKAKAKTSASWQTRVAAAGGALGGAAVVYQFLHAVWPAVSAYLLTVK